MPKLVEEQRANMWSWSSSSQPPSSFPYGDIREVDTTGASEETASASGKRSGGVSASEEMAKDDLPYIKKYRDEIINAANEYKVQPSVVAGIISRETRGGRGTGFYNGWGDKGNAFGLMQIDKRVHKKLEGAWNSQEHLEQGLRILIGYYSDVKKKFPSWNNNKLLKGALAAYNKGTKYMASSYKDVDKHTTGKDYANDVTARAQYYEEHLKDSSCKIF